MTETNETRTIEHADIKRILEERAKPISLQTIAQLLDTTDLLSLQRMVNNIRNDGEISLTFDSEGNKLYQLAKNPPLVPGPASKQFKDHSYKQVEKKILAAIKDHHCTIGQIKRHAGFAAGDDISEILDGMFMEDKIVRDSNGEITAIFLTGQVPQHWHIQDGITAFNEAEPSITEARKAELIKEKQAEIDEKNAARQAADAEARRLLDLPEETELPEPIAEAAASLDDALDDIESINEMVEQQESTKKKRRPYANSLSTSITVEQVEQAAAECSSRLKLGHALGFKGVSASNSVDKLFRKRPELLEAYERGKARSSGVVDSRPQEPETTSEPSDELPTPETYATESVEQEAPISPESEAAEIRDESKNEAVPETVRESANINLIPCHNCGHKYKTVSEATQCFEQHAKLKGGFSKDREAAVGKDGFEMFIPLGPKSDGETFDIKSFDRLDPKEPHVSKEWITLANGSQIMFAFEGDLLTLSRSDKALVDLIYKIANGYPSKFEVVGDDSKVKLNLPGSESEPKHRDGWWRRIRRAISSVEN